MEDFEEKVEEVIEPVIQAAGKLCANEFKAALTNGTLDNFLKSNKILKGISSAQVIAIAKMLCSAADEICPYINSLPAPTSAK